MYPNGATRQGVLDMAGNVEEWCLNKYHDPEKPKSVRLDDSDASRVVRGGSWLNGPGSLRASLRSGYTAGTRDNDLGFRLAQGTR